MRKYDEHKGVYNKLIAITVLKLRELIVIHSHTRAASPYARIRHPSPFRLTFPTPPIFSRTTSQSPVEETTSLISSAVSTSPSGSSPPPPPFVKFQLGRAIPCGLTARRHTCSRSIMISGSGKGTFNSATTFGWCGVGESVATRTRVWLLLVPSAAAAVAAAVAGDTAPPPPSPTRDKTRVHVQGVSESSGSLSSSSSSSRRRPGELPTSLVVDMLCPDVVERRFSALSAVPERLGGDAEPLLSGGPPPLPIIVLARRFAPTAWLPSRSTFLFFLPRLHTKWTSTTPSSGGVRDCRRSSDRPS
jgi:hypothetical protein